MKYPQLVSMPSAVQDWLDEQLEARGIDAVVYTRYVVSLLQRDTLDRPEDLLALSPGKAKGDVAGRRGRKRGRREEACWNAWDKERLRRTAAVQCLMSASDQKCGIEKLVDELCIKLKEIQSEGDSTVRLEFSQNDTVNEQRSHMTPSSPQDLAQKYYAAFPPLSTKTSEFNPINCNPVAEATSSVWSRRVLKNNQEIAATATSSPENKEIAEASSSPINKELEEMEEKREKSGTRCPPSMTLMDISKDEERGLAQLIAKFDESIEALWADDDRDNKQTATGISSFSTPPLIRPSPGESLFLHRGTNITSSIWSQAPDPPIIHNIKITQPWSDAEISCSSMLGNFTNFGFSYNNNNNCENVGEKGGDRGWRILNHNAKDSCFTAVVPGARHTPPPVAPIAAPTSTSPTHKILSEVEEDLLTSTRTHFRPIRQHESLGWADGTSFIIPNSLEAVSFRRSESGTLYLDADARYMEYKEKEPYGGRNQLTKPTPSPNLSSLSPSPTTPFVPKFRVRQNEKCCQTDSDGELESKRSRQDEMYFPGDEQALAEESDNSLYEECKCQPWTSKFAPNRVWDPPQLRWNDVWGSPRRAAACRACSQQPTGRPHSGGDQSALKLRKELSEDGEQLLSDLSYLQLYLGSEWLDESTLTNKNLDPGFSPLDDYSNELVNSKESSSFKSSQAERPLKSKLQDFVSVCQSATNKLPNSFESMETDMKTIERPFIINLASQKDRKRRHSACLRVAVSTAPSNTPRSLTTMTTTTTTTDDSGGGGGGGGHLTPPPPDLWPNDNISSSNGIKCSLIPPHQAERVYRPVTL